MNLTITATYSDGVLVPQGVLDLPENALVQIEITSVEQKKSKRKSLFGAFPELAVLVNVADDVKQIWNDRRL
ncbi:antitoxin family protein [Chloroflexi bacterium TSY]|nr:antitoxin family protein [Chloroflexi bacterium TSY]